MSAYDPERAGRGVGPERAVEIEAMYRDGILGDYCSVLCEAVSQQSKAAMLAIRLEQGRPEIDINTDVVLEPEVDCSVRITIADGSTAGR